VTRRPAPPRPSGIITLLTDFGLDDPYVGIVKGVLLGINPAARLVDLTHGVAPQDVLRGALALHAAYHVFPRGTVHLAVVDPGVGSRRRPLAVLAAGQYFVGPDNGLFGFLLETPPVAAVALINARYQRWPRSRTFHARDVFAPVAAHCSLGVPLARFGPPAHGLVRIGWPRPRRIRHRVVGQVLVVDRFGNLLTNLSEGDLPGRPNACVVEVAGTPIGPIVDAYSAQPVGALGAVVDSSGRLEVFVREGSAQTRLAAGLGTPVTVWSPASRGPSVRRRRLISRRVGGS
jgi:S-adenosylmethionine hydrolase